MSTLTVQNIQGSSSSSNTISVASGHKISGAAGAISVPGQVVQAVQLHTAGNVGTSSSSTVTTTSTSYVDFIQKAITTKLANSLIFIKTYSMHYNNATVYGDGRILRDSTEIDACKYQFYIDGGNIFIPFGFQLLDSPGAAAGTTITYKQQVKLTSSGTIRVGYGDSGGKVNTNMVLMEIAN